MSTLVLGGAAAVKYPDTKHLGYRCRVARPPNKPPTIRQVRYRLLLQQLEEDLAQEAIAAKVGVSQALVSQILRNAKNAGEATIDTARQRMRIREDFFSDTTLGDAPRHTDYIETAERVEDEDTKHALDELLQTWPEAARWRPEMGEPPNELEQAWLQSYSFREDRRRGLAVDADLLRDRLLARRRQQRGRAVERPAIEAPARENVIRVDEHDRTKR